MIISISQKKLEAAKTQNQKAAAEYIALIAKADEKTPCTT
jgi:hypothetical protein